MEQEQTQEQQPQGIDICVISHNRLDLTMRCINYLYRYTKIPFHLIVVDDSTDLSPLWLRELAKEKTNVTFVHSGTPYKTGNQIFNVGLANCKTNHMATVMNSVQVEPDWEIGAIQLMQNDPKIGVVGMKCLLPNGLIESAGIKLLKYLPCDIGRDAPSHWFTLSREVDAVQWAFAVVKVDAARGVLEEDTFYGFRGWDDIDNCMVLKKNGWKIFYCGAGAGFHEPRATRGDDSKQAEIENKANGERFYKRWGLWDDYIKDHPDGKDIHAIPIMEVKVDEKEPERVKVAA